MKAATLSPELLDISTNTLPSATTRKRAPSRRPLTSGCRTSGIGSTWCRMWWIGYRTTGPWF